MSTPATTMPFEALAWHLALPVWSTVRGEPRFDLAPAAVLAAPAAHPRHWQKIQTISLEHPLELFENRGRFVIVDGYHRLCRHQLEGRSEVPVRLHPAPLWEHVRPDPADPAP